MVHYWDWSAAWTFLERGHEFNAQFATNHQWRGLFFAAVGKSAEASFATEQAANLDPESVCIASQLAWLRLVEGHTQLASDLFQLLPNDFFLGNGASLDAIYAHTECGQVERAVADYLRTSTRPSQDRAEALRKGFGTHGPRGFWTEMCDEMDAGPWAWGSALAHGAAGDAAGTLQAIERAFRENRFHLFLIGVAPQLRFLHSDTHFRRMLVRVGVDGHWPA